CTPDDLFLRVALDILAADGRRLPTTRAEWTALKREGAYDGTPLWDLGFWDIAGSRLSHEAYAYMRDGNGYDCNNWAAAEVMQTQVASFGSATSYRVLEG